MNSFPCSLQGSLFVNRKQGTGQLIEGYTNHTSHSLSPAPCSSHSHHGASGKHPGQHGHKHGGANAHHHKAQSIGKHRASLNSKVQSLENLFNQALSKYTSTYSLLGEEMLKNAAARGEVARHTNQVVTQHACPKGGVQITKNGLPWCCPTGSLLNATTDSTGKLIADCKGGEPASYAGSLYINQFGYAQPVNSKGLSKQHITPHPPPHPHAFSSILGFSSAPTAFQSPAGSHGPHQPGPSGAHHSTSLLSSAHPSSHPPSASHLASAHPSSAHPSSAHPSSTHPSSAHPSSAHPSSTHPSSTPASTHPSSAHPSSTPSSSPSSSSSSASKSPTTTAGSGKCPAWAKSSTGSGYTYDESDWGCVYNDAGCGGWKHNTPTQLQKGADTTACAWIAACGDDDTCLKRCPAAVAIAGGETTFDPNAMGWDGQGRGLWQVNKGNLQAFGGLTEETVKNPVLLAKAVQAKTNNGMYMSPPGYCWSTCTGTACNPEAHSGWNFGENRADKYVDSGKSACAQAIKSLKGQTVSDSYWISPDQCAVGSPP